MFRMGKVLARVRRRIAFKSNDTTGPVVELDTRLAMVAAAIHQRECNGQSTTLRQLHKISELSQPDALAVVAELERAEIVRIERNMSDAFESSIALSENARRRMDDARSAEAA